MSDLCDRIYIPSHQSTSTLCPRTKQAKLANPSPQLLEQVNNDGNLEYYESFVDILAAVEGAASNPALSHFTDLEELTACLVASAIAVSVIMTRDLIYIISIKIINL